VRELPFTTIWLDPGFSTGFATLTGGEFSSFQTEGLEDFGDMLHTMLDASGFGAAFGLSTAVGWESYLVTGARSRESTVALRVIGVAQWLAHRYAAEMLPEVPSSARTAVSDAVLRALGWYTPGLPHANQAARHLAAWLAREHLLTPDQRKAFTSVLSEGTSE
jgi:hypothetical protein